MRLKRQFWLGMLVGLGVGGVLRRLSTGGFSQESIRRVYSFWAPIYDLSNVYMLGQLGRLRRLAAERLRLQPGASLLEVSCGTGANFPNLQERIGPTGRLVGVDYTPAMLAEAERLVEREGWQNVELLQADARQLDLGEQFDAVLWMLAATVVPDWQVALERAVAHVKHGGRLVVADARFSERWYARPFNWYTDIMGAGAAADMGRRPWELLPQHLTKVGYEDLLLGFLYVAWGQKEQNTSEEST
jgi:demethylmenaquinone methyltransferase/2-methoxy-6-polyprenyl-1,4-benzoquinol methylase